MSKKRPIRYDAAVVKNGFQKNPLDGTFFALQQVRIHRAADQLKIFYTGAG